ncbi:MAG: phosphate acyltransferase PlsX [Acidimicrobiia bacterium]
MLPLAVDVMGADRGPSEIVAGARQASEDHGIPVVLVGQPEVLETLDTGGLPVMAASEVVEMHDDPAGAIRRKRDASVVRAAEAVRDGAASGMVSAGNTGAAVASALLRMGRITGVQRPCIATVLPRPGSGSHPTILVDSGANAECSAGWLLQFGQMGAVYANARFGIEPNVGLVSIGEEPTKGTALVKEAHALMSDGSVFEGTTGTFIGNVEGRDAINGSVDVMVTDGFTGNVLLKTLEGSARAMVDAVLAAMNSSAEAKAASEALVPALLPLYVEMDPDTYGGAMLLGVDGVCIISHGKSTARAIVNAVRLGADMVSTDLVGRLRAVVGKSRQVVEPG